ncbi:MAG: protein translocase subunit SecF [Acidobacteria bacterium]|nr:MAG: protein translocase subunit SecF [Acidobacteriota bacterium]
MGDHPRRRLRDCDDGAAERRGVFRRHDRHPEVRSRAGPGTGARGARQGDARTGQRGDHPALRRRLVEPADDPRGERRRRVRDEPEQRRGPRALGAQGGEHGRLPPLATVLSLVGILLYIAFRYQFSFGVGAVIATIHDLLVTFAFLAFFRYDLSLNVIAAILTVTGYSTNDTIVIFDRVRENLRSMRRDNLEHVINVSVNQTLSRTIITAGTALLSALALFFFGGEVLHGFAFTMIVGIITGTYSSVFIAAAIAVIWQGRKPVKTAPAAAQAPAPAVDRKPASTARKRRRA